MRVVLAIAALLIASACGSTPVPRTLQSSTSTTSAARQSSRHEQVASLERTSCFGWCPVYKVTIFRDGVVEYKGKEYVKTKGRAIGHLSAEQVAALDELFLPHYFLLDDSYERSQTTDFPSVYTSYSFEGSTKTIRHYLADDCPVPPILVRIENEIQRLVRIEQWIGTEKEREMLFLTKR